MNLQHVLQHGGISDLSTCPSKRRIYFGKTGRAKINSAVPWTIFGRASTSFVQEASIRSDRNVRLVLDLEPREAALRSSRGCFRWIPTRLLEHAVQLSQNSGT